MQEETIANLLAQYSLADLLEGFEEFLEEQESQLYYSPRDRAYLKDEAHEEGTPFMSKESLGHKRRNDTELRLMGGRFTANVLRRPPNV